MITGFGKGLDLDTHPSSLQGFRYALNAIHKRDLAALSNEGGSKFKVLLKEGFEILGQIYINQNDKVVFLGNGIDSEIGRIRNQQYETVFDNSELNFQLGSYISGTFKYNENNEAIIYFTDYVNDIRYLNIDDVPTVGDIRQLRIYRFISNMSSVSVDRVNSSGGSLNLGQYFFFYSYVDSTGIETPIINGTKGIQIGKESIQDNPYLKYRGGNSDELTNKSIDISITSLDTNYSLVRLYVLKHFNGSIQSIERLADLDIRTSSIQFTYTGLESTLDSSLDKLNEVVAYYSAGKSLAQIDNALYIANLKERPEDPRVFQPIANAINVHRVEQLVTTFGTDYNWKAPLAINQRSHFMNDEVYALYISFIWNDGSETAAYHIPGKIDPPSDGYRDSDALTTLKSYSPWNGVNQSADIDEFLTNFPDAKIFHYYGFEDATTKMGYWENKNEVYPDIPEIWGANSGMPVRHHRFPAPQEVEHIRTDNNYYVNGIQLKNVVIPTELQDDIIGWKVYYAKRTESNKRILDQSYLSIAEYNESADVNAKSVYLSGASATGSGSLRIADCASAVPFTLTRNQTNPNTISFIRPVSRLNFVNNLIVDNSTSNSYTGTFRQAVEYTYYDFQSSGLGKELTLFPTKKILGTSIGTDTPFDQEVVGTPLEENTTLMYSYHFGFAEDLTTAEPNYIANFHTGLEDLYNSFDKQSLVFTGYVHTNIQLTSSDDIFGGDCNVGEYAHFGLGFVNYSTISGAVADVTGYRRDLYRVVIEQQENIGLRQEGDIIQEDAPNQLYYPAFTSSQVLDVGELTAAKFEQESFYKNYLEINESYSAVPEFTSTGPQDARREITSQNLITRVIRSATHTPGNLIDQFRNFGANSYIDLPLNRGHIEVIKSYNNLLLIHLERALAITRGKDKLQIDTTNVYLGDADLFSSPPEEILMTEEGHAGNHNIEGSLVTPFGYFFVDRESRILYNFNKGIEAISEGSLSNWMYDNAPFYTDTIGYRPTLDPEDKQILSYQLGYDARYKRVLITKHDIEPTATFLEDLSETVVEGAIVLATDGYYYKYESQIGPGGTPSLTPTKIQYSDTQYFTRKHFTVSYDPIVKGFISFHSYNPDMYLIDRENLQTVYNDRLWQMNANDTPGLFYGTYYNFEVEGITNYNPSQLGNGQNFRLRNLTFVSSATSQDNTPLYRETFDKVYMYNENQCTGIETLSNLSNIRSSRGEWSFNKFRDKTLGGNIFTDTYDLELNESNIDQNLPWYKRNRLIDTFTGFRLIYENTSKNNLITLHSAAAVPVQTNK